MPPREHGGNCDIKNISRGTRIYFPVYVKGAKLSLGDLHFSQGDGEITFCGAIEMAGWIDLHVDLIKGGVGMYGLTNPLFKVSPVDPHYGDYLVFEGISVGRDPRSPVEWDLNRRFGSFAWTGALSSVTYTPGADAPDAPSTMVDMLREIGRAFVVHGEPEAATAMAQILREEGVRKVEIPRQGEQFTLA